MKKTLCPEDAVALKKALDVSFESCEFDGKAKLPDEPICIGAITIPPGAGVHFTPTRFRGFTEYFKVLERDSDHAIIFIDEDRGSTIRIDGTCTQIDARNCA